MILETNDIMSEGKTALPTGRRKLSVAAVRCYEAVEAFSGLPQTSHGKRIAHPGDLLAVIKSAKRSLGLRASDLQTLDALFELTQVSDWAPPFRPMVWPSNEYLAYILGISTRAVINRLNRLINKGLIVMRSSGNGKRFGQRTKEKQIVLGRTYGIDLSPAAVFYGTFVAAAEEDRADYQAIRKAYRNASAGVMKIKQLVEAADKQGVWTTYWEEVEMGIDALSDAVRRVKGRETLEELVAQLAKMEEDATAVLLRASADKGNAPSYIPSYENITAPMGEEKSSQIPLQTDPAQKTVTKMRADPALAGSEEEEESGLTLHLRGQEQKQQQGARQGASVASAQDIQAQSEIKPSATDKILHIPTTSPGEIAALTPELAAYCSPEPSWAELGQAAEKLRHPLGIGDPIWREAHSVLGPIGRIMALAVILSWPTAHFRSGRGGYLRGMIEAALAGRLRLAESLDRMRKMGAREPDASIDAVRAPNGHSQSLGDIAALLSARNQGRFRKN